MISETQYYVVNVGDDVSMECSFHADRYSMFDHPVLWRKQQLDEFSQINILGSINDPFMQTNRYKVTIDASEPRYRFQLRISGHTINHIFTRSSATAEKQRVSCPCGGG